MSTERDAIRARTRSDALRLLRTIDANQAHGREGARVYLPRAAQEAGLEVDSERYEDAMTYLVKQAASRRDERMAFDENVADRHPRGYGLYVFTRRALKMVDRPAEDIYQSGKGFCKPRPEKVLRSAFRGRAKKCGPGL